MDSTLKFTFGERLLGFHLSDREYERYMRVVIITLGLSVITGLSFAAAALGVPAEIYGTFAGAAGVGVVRAAFRKD